MAVVPDTLDELMRDAMLSSAQRVRRAGTDDPIARELARARLFGGSEPRIGRYRVVRMIGAGGMGIVYRARDVELDRDVALKMLSGEADERRDARLQREARALARLSHPNVVQVFDFGHAFGRFLLAMELVDGPTLRRWQRNRTVAEILAAYLEAGRGIAAAHANGLLHLDLKPDNILVGSDGRPRVADFGLVADGPTEEREAGSSRGELGTSSLAGTPAYMSPEQLRREPLDERSDIYSFCVALFESLTGTRPPTETGPESQARTLSAHPRDNDPRPVVAVPRRLRAALDKGLSIDRDDRFASMDALLSALDVRPRRVWIAGASIVAVVAGAASLEAAEPSAPACGDVATMSPAWNDDIDDRIVAHFAEVQPGGAAWSTLRPDVVAYGDEWARARAEICSAEAPAEHAVSCLARSHEHFAVVLESFAEADASAIERAVDLIEELPAPRRCAATSEAPATVDPATRAMQLALERRLANLRARIDVGLATALDAESEALVGEALAQPDPGLRARAWLVRADLLDRELRHREAAAALEDAYFLASRAGLPEETLRAATRLVHVHGQELGDPSRGLEWAEHAEAEIERMGLDPRRVWLLRRGRVTTLMKANRLDEAEAEARDALAAIAEDRSDVDGEAEQNFHEAIGHIMVMRGRMPEGQREFERALELAIAEHGDDHPGIGSALVNLATPLGAQGQREASEKYLRDALRLWTRAYGEDSPRLSVVLVNLANTIDAPERTREALDLALESLRIAELHGFSTVKQSEIHHTIGNLYQRLDDLDRAASHYETERSGLEATLGLEHPELGHALHSLGRVQAKRGHHDEARALFEQTLALWRAAYGDDHLLVSFPLHSLGDLALQEGRPAAAIPFLREALVLRIAHPGEPTKLAQTRFALARALWDTGGDRNEARTLAEEARVGFVAEGTIEAKRLAEVDAWLRDRKPR